MLAVLQDVPGQRSISCPGAFLSSQRWMISACPPACHPFQIATAFCASAIVLRSASASLASAAARATARSRLRLVKGGAKRKGSRRTHVSNGGPDGPEGLARLSEHTRTASPCVAQRACVSIQADSGRLGSFGPPNPSWAGPAIAMGGRRPGPPKKGRRGKTGAEASAWPRDRRNA